MMNTTNRNQPTFSAFNIKPNSVRNFREEFDALQQDNDAVEKDTLDVTKFSTGAKRSTKEGKVQWYLIPTDSLERVAKVFTHGAKEYGKDNWRKGIPYSSYMDSALRHLYNAMKHLENGTESDEDELAHCVANLLMLMSTKVLVDKNLLSDDLDDMRT